MIRRRLFTVASVLSLLLCVATVALWVRSYKTFDDLDRIHTSLTPTEYTQHLIRLGSDNGRFLFTWRDIIWPSYNPSFSYVTSRGEEEKGIHFASKDTFDLYRPLMKQPNEESWEKNLAGVRFERLLRNASPATLASRHGPHSHFLHFPGMKGIVIIVPHAYMAVILTVVAVLSLIRRPPCPRDGYCPTCGYNLTGNTSGVCPECGTAITPSAPARRRGG